MTAEENVVAAGDLTVELTDHDLRAVAGYAVACAREPAAGEAARAALLAASAPCLHPLATPTQVKHILGPAAHTARALELGAGGDVAVGARHVEHARAMAAPDVVDGLLRYPAAPSGGGRTGQLRRALDASLR